MFKILHKWNLILKGLDKGTMYNLKECNIFYIKFLNYLIFLFLLKKYQNYYFYEIIKEFHIHLLSTGRISIPGLNKYNIKYVAESIDKVIRN